MSSTLKALRALSDSTRLRMMALLEASDFVARFLDKGVMRPFLQTVPVQVVDHAQLGVVGAASWLHERSANS